MNLIDEYLQMTKICSATDYSDKSSVRKHNKSVNKMYEIAEKIGDVNIIPSEIENRYLSIRSSDLLETQFGVRELRGKD